MMKLAICIYCLSQIMNPAISKRHVFNIRTFIFIFLIFHRIALMLAGGKESSMVKEECFQITLLSCYFLTLKKRYGVYTSKNWKLFPIEFFIFYFLFLQRLRELYDISTTAS